MLEKNLLLQELKAFKKILKSGTALMSTVANWDHVECLKQLVDAGRDVNDQAFMFAVKGGYVDCSKELIVAGAEIDQNKWIFSKWNVKKLLKGGECCRH